MKKYLNILILITKQSLISFFFQSYPCRNSVEMDVDCFLFGLCVNASPLLSCSKITVCREIHFWANLRSKQFLKYFFASLAANTALSSTAPPTVRIIHSGNACNVEEERHTERVYTIREGETLELTCLVTGHPRPQVRESTQPAARYPPHLRFLLLGQIYTKPAFNYWRFKFALCTWMLMIKI